GDRDRIRDDGRERRGSEKDEEQSGGLRGRLPRRDGARVQVPDRDRRPAPGPVDDEKDAYREDGGRRADRPERDHELPQGLRGCLGALPAGKDLGEGGRGAGAQAGEPGDEGPRDGTGEDPAGKTAAPHTGRAREVLRRDRSAVPRTQHEGREAEESGEQREQDEGAEVRGPAPERVPIPRSQPRRVEQHPPEGA